MPIVGQPVLKRPSREITPIIHRHALDEISQCKFSVQALVHLSRYEKAASLFEQVAQEKNCPISVVSLGCGEMRELEVFWNTFWCTKSDVLASYTGIDVEACPIPVRNRNGKVQIQCILQDFMNVPKLPFKNGDVDLVVATEFIEHVSCKVAVDILDEISRVLSPGGIVYLSTPNGSIAKENKYHFYQYSIEEIEVLLTSRGITIEGTWGDFVSMRRVVKVDKDLAELANCFGPNFARLFMATSHPEISDGVSYLGRKNASR